MSINPCNIIFRRSSIIFRRSSIFSGKLKKRLQTPLSPQSFSTIPHQSHHNILPLCASTKSLAQTKQSHAIALLNGHLPNSISISASLILQYATFGDPSTSILLFHQSLPYSRSAFLWNTMTRAYTIAGVYDGFMVYNLMICSGVRPDDHTFPFVLKVCSDYHEVWKGKEVHGLVFKSGFGSDVFVGNTLLRFYGECSGVSDAEKVFDEMSERDIVSYNTLIAVCSVLFRYDKAVGLFLDMISRLDHSRVKPNVVTIVSLLPVCAAINDCTFTSELHGYIIKTGFGSHITINNALIDAYGKCGDSKACKQVFNEMVDRNDVSWNTIITSFAFMNHQQEALEFFKFMIDKGITPNSVTVSSMLPILIDLECFQSGLELHCFSIRRSIESDIFVANSLLDMYAKFGHPIKASNVFKKIDSKNIVSWNTMVANYAQNGFESLALSAVKEMQDHGQVPGPITLTNVLPACGRIGHFAPGKQVHARSIRCGFAFELFVSNALIDMYAKCGRLDLAHKVFKISCKDRISYNTLISAYSHSDASSESLVLFRELFSKRVEPEFKPDAISFSGALSACANMAEIKKGKEIHGVSVKTHFHTHLIVSNSILDLYTKCGNLVLAKKVFDRIPVKDIASWNTMITGYGTFGETESAIGLFEAMRGVSHVKRDPITYLAVLSVCSRGGLVEPGRKYFNEMKEDKIEPSMSHYACMVDLFGRAGLMDEAVAVIDGLGVEPDANVWGSLLGACRIHGNIELGHWAANHLFELKPNHSGYYTLLCNMYSEAGRWYEADKIRELMKIRGVKKNPGFSWADD